MKFEVITPEEFREFSTKHKYERRTRKYCSLCWSKER